MKFDLKRLEAPDIDMLNVWLDKPHISKWFHHKEDWIKEIECRETDFNFITHYIFFVDGVQVGFCQYYDYSKGGEDFQGDFKIDHTASIDYLIGVEEYLGKRYSLEMVKLLEEEIIKNTDFINIIVQPEQDNLISRNTLFSAGYTYDKNNDLFVKYLIH